MKKLILAILLMAASSALATEYDFTATGMDSTQPPTRLGFMMHQNTDGDMVMHYRWYTSGYLRMLTWDGASWTTSTQPMDNQNRGGNSATLIGADDSSYFVNMSLSPAVGKMFIRKILGTTLSVLDTPLVGGVDSQFSGNGGVGFMQKEGKGFMGYWRYECGLTDSLFLLASDSPVVAAAAYAKIDASPSTYNAAYRAYPGKIGTGSGTRDIILAYIPDIGQDRVFIADSVRGFDTAWGGGTGTFMGEKHTNKHFCYDIAHVMDSFWVYATQDTVNGDIKVVRFKLVDRGGATQDTIIKLDSQTVETESPTFGTLTANQLAANVSWAKQRGADRLVLIYKYFADVANTDSIDIAYRIFTDTCKTMGNRTIFQAAVNGVNKVSLTTAPSVSLISGSINPWVAYADGTSTSLAKITLFTNAINISGGGGGAGQGSVIRSGVIRGGVIR